MIVLHVQYTGIPGSDFAAINVDVIFPCTAKHISKYSQQKSMMLAETAEMYAAVTEPHIATIPAGATAWVINILEKKKEADRMIFEDPDPTTGFVLHPDLKWDRVQVFSPRPPPHHSQAFSHRPCLQAPCEHAYMTTCVMCTAWVCTHVPSELI